MSQSLISNEFLMFLAFIDLYCGHVEGDCTWGDPANERMMLVDFTNMHVDVFEVGIPFRVSLCWHTTAERTLLFEIILVMVICDTLFIVAKELTAIPTWSPQYVVSCHAFWIRNSPFSPHAAAYSVKCSSAYCSHQCT
jgi:hypothetical protein